jgi:hypothetical protein
MAAPFDCAAFAARYGYSPQEYLVKVIVGLIHVNPARYDIEGIDPSEKAQGERDDQTRKQAALDWVAGKVEFTSLLSYMGGISQQIVRNCPWDEDQIRTAVQGLA